MTIKLLQLCSIRELNEQETAAFSRILLLFSAHHVFLQVVLYVFKEQFTQKVKPQSSSPPPEDIKSSSPPPDDIKSSSPPPDDRKSGPQNSSGASQ